jgi:prepilin peptidase CpaA
MPAPLQLAGGVVFVALLAAACVTDARERRIPNRLVVTLALLGVVYSVATAPWLVGAQRALLGALVGVAIWLPFHLMGWMGAGDVKLFGAASAWLGPAFALRASLLAALLGGVLALVWLARARLQANPGERRLPYGIAMAAALALAAWW